MKASIWCARKLRSRHPGFWLQFIICSRGFSSLMWHCWIRGSAGEFGGIKWTVANSAIGLFSCTTLGNREQPKGNHKQRTHLIGVQLPPQPKQNSQALGEQPELPSRGGLTLRDDPVGKVFETAGALEVPKHMTNLRSGSCFAVVYVDARGRLVCLGALLNLIWWRHLDLWENAVSEDRRCKRRDSTASESCKMAVLSQRSP